MSCEYRLYKTWLHYAKSYLRELGKEARTVSSSDGKRIFLADMATSELQALLDSFEARLSTVEQSVGTRGGGAGGGGASGGAMSSSSREISASGGDGGDVPESVSSFDEYCASCLDPFVSACETLGGGAAAGVSA